MLFESEDGLSSLAAHYFLYAHLPIPFNIFPHRLGSDLFSYSSGSSSGLLLLPPLLRFLLLLLLGLHLWGLS